MHFELSEEQQLLERSLSQFLKSRYSFEQRQAIVLSGSGHSADVWQAFSQELGILGVGLPEDAGGFGDDPISVMVIMRTLGQMLVTEPWLHVVVQAGTLLARCTGESSSALLTQLISGESLPVLAAFEARSRYDITRIETTAERRGEGWVLNGSKSVVRAAPWASHLLVVARESESRSLAVFCVPAGQNGVRRFDYPTVDEARASDLVFENCTLPDSACLIQGDAAKVLLDEAIDRSIAAQCAEAVGVLSQLLEDTVEYTSQRKQFGQPLAKFQALQHRMVDMYIQLEMARSAMYLATLKLGESASDRAKAVSAAKVTVAEACRFIGQNAVQLHGGMGMTDELALSHYFKRATAIELELGSRDYHLQRHAHLSAVA